MALLSNFIRCFLHETIPGRIESKERNGEEGRTEGRGSFSLTFEGEWRRRGENVLSSPGASRARRTVVRIEEGIIIEKTKDLVSVEGGRAREASER